MIIDDTVLIKKIEAEKISFSELQQNEIIFKQFWDDFLLRFCWSSNALEGNTLDLDDTIDIILYDEVKSGHTYKEYTEAKNSYKAIDSMLSKEKINIDEDWIKEVNSIIMNDEKSYRKKNVYIGTLVEEIYRPPHFTKIEKEMNDFIKYTKEFGNDLETIVKQIAEYHIKFERIHPFNDGNGRTGRMVLNQQLINNDLLPIAFKNTSKYRQSFRHYENNKDISLLSHLIFSGESDSINRAKELQYKYDENERKILHESSTKKK